MTREDRDYLQDLVKHVERISPPPLQHIQGPGFVMLGNRPEPKPRNYNHLLFGALGGFLSSGVVAISVILWLVNT